LFVATNSNELSAHAARRARVWLETTEPVAPDGHTARAWWALGDPQAPFDTVIEVLAAHDLLAEDGALRPEVGLVSMGDHFDFHAKRPLDWVGEQGVQILGWLASHPPDQVALMLGNHDVARVQELAFESDASFAAARQLADEIAALPSSAKTNELIEKFHRDHPRIPTPGIAGRDYSSFSVAQRALVQRLLLDGRFALARAATLTDGTPALITHAGITMREARLLGAESDRDVAMLATALEAELGKAIAEVRTAWSTGEPRALELRELHVAGVARREGHGMLYHRPADPDREGIADKAWEFDSRGARRFTPRTLPLGLVQIVGHVGHARCLREMPNWVDDTARQRSRGGLRTLSFDGHHVVYRNGVHPVGHGAAGLYMIDPELFSDDARPWELFRLGGVACTSCVRATRESLPEDPWRYFVQAPHAELIPVVALQTIRARAEGIANAAIHMAAAYNGEGLKRQPVSLTSNLDGTYTVTDGNSTVAVARSQGWRLIPATIRG
jgi:hypothetical protein